MAHASMAHASMAHASMAHAVKHTAKRFLAHALQHTRCVPSKRYLHMHAITRPHRRLLGTLTRQQCFGVQLHARTHGGDLSCTRESEPVCAATSPSLPRVRRAGRGGAEWGRRTEWGGYTRTHTYMDTRTHTHARTHAHTTDMLEGCAPVRERRGFPRPRGPARATHVSQALARDWRAAASLSRFF
jgi:hypothetical protein